MGDRVGGFWGFAHLDLGSEILHDGADELGLAWGEGGVGAGSGGLGGVFHGCGISFCFGSCMGVFGLGVAEDLVDVRSRSSWEVSSRSHDCLFMTFTCEGRADASWCTLLH